MLRPQQTKGKEVDNSCHAGPPRCAGTEDPHHAGPPVEPADELEALLASLEATLAGSAHDESRRREYNLEEEGEGVLAQILAPHLAREEEQTATEQQRFAVYLADLRHVLRVPGGAGVRVLRHWLDASCAFTRIHGPAPHIYATAALADFSRDRMAEIALADPAGHIRMQLIGARQWAQGMRVPGE